MADKQIIANDIFSFAGSSCDTIKTPGKNIVPRFINEFWTSKQRQGNSIHEISYRACFKSQLPSFFIKRLTKPGDSVFDPFAGRGTTVIEAALSGRKIVSNDINPLSGILCKPRLFIPLIHDLNERLNEIPFKKFADSDTDLSMFYHHDTFSEISSLKNYLIQRHVNNEEDYIDSWIRMIATNRLTGHSEGFFSVYTLPPNQAMSPLKQVKINAQRHQKPEYRDTRSIILKKSKSLLKDITKNDIENLRIIGNTALFLTNDAGCLTGIDTETIHLTVTSPPFLDVVQYADDNWLRCWFNNLNVNEIGAKITMARTLDQWIVKMESVFKELYRITKTSGHVAFEAGEVRKGKINLDENVADIGCSTGFTCDGIMINQQLFTKTSNIWGISNNERGTNTNRIVIFTK